MSKSFASSRWIALQVKQSCAGQRKPPTPLLHLQVQASSSCPFCGWLPKFQGAADYASVKHLRAQVRQHTCAAFSGPRFRLPGLAVPLAVAAGAKVTLKGGSAGPELLLLLLLLLLGASTSTSCSAAQDELSAKS